MSEMRAPMAVFGEALCEVGDRFKNVAMLSADSSKGSWMGPFKARFADRHIEFGIMEQGVLRFAAGLATTGKIPLVAAIAPLVTAIWGIQRRKEGPCGVLMKEGGDLAVIGTGITLEKAAQASHLREEKGISIMPINIHTLKPAGRGLLVKAAKETRRIVTVEDHYLPGGLGSIVAEVLARECPVPTRTVGIDDQRGRYRPI